MRIALNKAQAPPTIGQVAEEIRRTLVDKFDTYFPILNMETQNDGRILLKARDQQSGLNWEITVEDKNQSLNVSTPALPSAQQPLGMNSSTPQTTQPQLQGN